MNIWRSQWENFLCLCASLQLGYIYFFSLMRNAYFFLKVKIMENLCSLGFDVKCRGNSVYFSDINFSVKMTFFCKHKTFIFFVCENL